VALKIRSQAIQSLVDQVYDTFTKVDKLTELVSTIIRDVVKTAKKEGYSDDEAEELVKSTFDMTEYYTNNIQEKAISFIVNDNFTKIDENLEQKDQTPEAQIRRLERDKFQLENKVSELQEELKYNQRL
jgi:chaperonin cofactor prefoldin